MLSTPQIDSFLAQFNESPLALSLDHYLVDRAKEWNGQANALAGIVNPASLLYKLEDRFGFDPNSPEWNSEWNSHHKQLAFIKAFKCLQRESVIEIVSLTKTKLTLGFIHNSAGAPFKLVFSGKTACHAERLLLPARWLKSNEWI